MSFFGNLFGEQKTQSLAILDVHAGSIGGSYVVLTKGQVPEVLYNTRMAIEAHDGEPAELAMERTFEALGTTLVRDGAPRLLRATKSGTADVVLCAISAPWQETSVRREHIEERSAFTFSKSTLDQALAKSAQVGPNQILVNEFAVGTILNGYETNDPIGKRTTRATVIILTSTLAKTVAEIAGKMLRALFHTKDIVLASGAAVRFQALRHVFPHERDYLILDAEGTEVTFSLVRHGLLVSTMQVESEKKEEWAARIQETLSTLAKDYPLPRTIFLLAREDEREFFKTSLESDAFNSLWLSDARPSITAVLPNHISPFVKLSGDTTPDLPLMAIALYASGVFADER